MDAAAPVDGGEATPLTVVLCGDSAVGKSTFGALASPCSSAAVFATHSMCFPLGASVYNVTLRDTLAGPESLEGRKSAYQGADVVFLLYSVISPASLTSAISTWRTELATHASGLPVILLGNKIDLRADAQVVERLARRALQPVSLEQGQRATQEVGALGFFEVSCVEGNPLERVFREGLLLVFGPPKTVGRRGAARSRRLDNNNNSNNSNNSQQQRQGGDDALRGKNCAVQ